MFRGSRAGTARTRPSTGFGASVSAFQGRRTAIGAAVVVLALGLQSAHAHAPSTVEEPSRLSPRVDVQLTRASASDRRRADAARDRSVELYTEWLGPLSGAAPIVVSPAWWPAPATMDVEAQVAFELARTWLGRDRADPRAARLVDGAAWYLQSRVVEDLFDYTFLRTAHSADGVRLFGRAVPWPVVSLRLSRWTAGLGRPEWLSPSGRSGARRLPPEVGHEILRGALAFGTLERYLGWPALQGALHVWARHAHEQTLTRVDIERLLAAATAQDLSWFFRVAFDSNAPFDYAVTNLSSARAGPGQCAADPCFLTAATVERLGDAVFSGSSRVPEGDFESGDALDVRVDFGDGRQATVRWDGRRASKTFVFESRAPAAAAAIDPDGVLLLDENRLNNVRRLTPVSNVPTRRWVARWMVWAEDFALAALAVLGA